MDKTILTGVKPTGAPHIGNYIGAIRPALALAATHKKSYLFIADYHALNIVRNPEALKRDCYEVAACWLALGLDPEKTIFYRQSDIPEIFELMNILCAVTPKGLMDRATSYRDAKAKNMTEHKDEDYNINMGLYTYPILMAADILMAQTDIVPVGKDQVQHIEFARDMAGYFNNTFSPVFKLPEHKLEKAGALLLGIDGQKMSKSYSNHIPVFMNKEERYKLIMKIKTDLTSPNEPKDPNGSIIFQLYEQFATPEETEEMRCRFLGIENKYKQSLAQDASYNISTHAKRFIGYGDAKKELYQVLERTFEKPTQIYNDYMADTKKIDELLAAGADKARKVARETLSAAREAVGLKRLP